MLILAATPFDVILGLFVLVPLAIVAGICGPDCAAALRRRPNKPS